MSYRNDQLVRSVRSAPKDVTLTDIRHSEEGMLLSGSQSGQWVKFAGKYADIRELIPLIERRDFGPHPRKDMLWNVDLGIPVSVVSKGRYTLPPGTHRNMLDDVLQRLSSYEINGQTLDPNDAVVIVNMKDFGARITVSVIFNHIDIEMPDGSICHPVFRYNHAVDKTGGVEALFMTIRSMCLNGMYFGQQHMMRVGGKHVGELDFDITSAMQNMVTSLPATMEQWFKWDREYLDSKLMAEFWAPGGQWKENYNQKGELVSHAVPETSPLFPILGASHSNVLHQVWTKPSWSRIAGLKDKSKIRTKFDLYNAATFLARRQNSQTSEDNILAKAHEVVEAYDSVRLTA